MNELLKQYRERAGLTQEEVAERMNISRSHYVKLERNERGLTWEMMRRASKALGAEFETALVAKATGQTTERETAHFAVMQANLRMLDENARSPTVAVLRNRLVPVPIVGIVEAGTFREVDELSHADDDHELVFEEPDPDFPRAKRFAFTVQGDSMNAAEPPLLDGYRLVCVDFTDAAVPLSDGMTVVVQRIRDGGLIREWSVKEVEMRETEIAFCPRSTNPRHKPIVVPLDPEPSDETQVEVIAIARSVTATIPRYRLR